ncbi:MAG: hypothetical protein ABW098_03170 [Candidatus Thiodiazotropha sp.]
MFGLFKKTKGANESRPEFIVVTINARIQPMHRGELFEDPLDQVLAETSIGEISGGGTLQSESGEIEHCDVEIQVYKSDDKTVNFIKSTMEKLGIPKGSKIHIESKDSVIEFGDLEGLAIYLNGTDLDDEVYAKSDSNHVYSELERLTEGVGKVYSYWQGPKETAFYLYGSSYQEMKSMIAELVDNYPLCQKCRIVQVA